MRIVVDMKVRQAISNYPEAYEEGIEASMDKKPLESCPYEDGDKRIAWRAGWFGVDYNY
jgi:ribosome modulation factor